MSDLEINTTSQLTRAFENDVLNIQGSKGGEEKPHQPVETPNNLLSVAYAKILVAVGEGEFAGTPSGRDIYLNGTPLIDSQGNENFGGVTWEWRTGTQDQTYIQGNPDVSSEFSIGVELTDQSPWVREITKESLSAVRVTLSWPALLKTEQNGDTVGYTIDYAIDLSTDGGPYQLYQNYQVSGKTNTAYERTHRVNLPTATTGWTIRVRRLTPNSQESTIQDKMNIKSFAEVVDAKQRYPNTALLFVQFDSRLFGGGNIPKISVDVKGRIVRIPTNYDPDTRTYTGVWDGTFKWGWTDNPAWVFFDIVTQDRFGLGNRVNINQIDRYEMYEVAQYCDVMVDDGTGSGNLEPRHTCNIYIQQQEDAWQVLRDVCTIFNGMTYWDGNQFIARADKQEPIDNIPLFSRANVVNGDFDYQAPDQRSIYTSALISYDEPADHYNSQVEAVWERSEILRWGGDRQTNIAAVGCTSRGEAQRKGKYNLITNMYNRTVSFKTGLQGLNEKVYPGCLIGVADPLIAGKPFTGRLIAATPTVVTLDRETEAVVGDKLFITKKDGSQEARTIQAVSGVVITVTTAYSETAERNSVWYLEASDLKSQLFRVTKLKPEEDQTFSVEAVEYNDSKYAAIDNGARLEPRPISKVPPKNQEAPSPITITSNTFIEQTMAVSVMTVSWPKTPNAVLYEGEWRIGQGDWVELGTTGAQEFNVRGIYTGQYVARVRAINAVGVKSNWSLSVPTQLNGKTGAPPTLASLTTNPLIYGIGLDWQFKPGSEDTARTEIYYSRTTSFDDAIKLSDFAFPQNTHELHNIIPGTAFFFWARLVDRTGNIGEYYPLSTEIGVRGQVSDSAGDYEQYFAGQINESALGQHLNDRIELIDGNGPGSVNARIDTAVDGLQEQIDDLTNPLNYDPNTAYLKDQNVQKDNKIWLAVQDVPAAADGSNAPPNATYWKDIGTIASDGEATAVQVQLNTTEILEIDGRVTSLATQLSVVSSEFREDDGEGDLADAIDGVRSKAVFTESVRTQASQNYAFGEHLTSLDASVAKNTASITTLDTVVATDRQATAESLSRIQSEVDENTASILQVSETVAEAEESIATIQTVVDSVYTSGRDDNGDGELDSAIEATNSAARFSQQVRTQATVNTSLVNATQTLQAGLNTTNAQVQTTSQALATLDNEASTMWSVKMSLNSQGQYVAAGIGLGIENGPAGLQSQFLVSADRFAVVNGTSNSSVPFIVEGSQVFIQSAFIKDGTITNAKIGSFISSTDYVQGTSGWRLDKNGTLEINGAVSGQGRLTITNRAVKVFDQNNTLRVQLGDLSA